jgi:hypothetical protein
MTILHQCLNQEFVHERESAVERLHLKWSSSSRVIVDRPPSQPLSRRQMSGGPSSGSVKDIHEGPGEGDAHRGGNVSEEFQLSDSKWASGSLMITDRPPLQPIRYGESAIKHSVEMKNHDIVGLEKSLEQLYLSNNNIGDDCCKSLADGLTATTGHKCLCLSSNDTIGTRGFVALLRKLEENRSLDSLERPVGTFASPHDEYLNANHQKNNSRRARAA